MFFAFAGYARIATLGEEVRDPARTIPRAIPIALGITLVVYAVVAVAVLAELGSAGLASSSAPLADAVRAAGSPRHGAGGAGRRGGRGARVAAVADSRRVEHDAGDGPRPAPAPRAVRGASAVRQPAPRRAGRRRCRRGAGRGGRRTRCDRLLRRSRCWSTTRSPTRRRWTLRRKADSGVRPGGLRAAGRSRFRSPRYSSAPVWCLSARSATGCGDNTHRDPADVETSRRANRSATSSSHPTND